MAWLNKNKKPGGRPTAGDKLANDSSIGSDFILSAIQDGVVMIGPDNTVRLFNPAASTITGWPVAEATGSDYKSVLTLADDKGQPLSLGQNPFAQSLATGKTMRDNHCTLVSRRKNSVSISVIVSPILDRGGKPTGNVVGVFRDVTKEKQEEQQRSDFISTASHEMRTPLAAIEGYLSLALNPKTAQVDANAKKYIEKAVAATTHLGVLFQDLLTSSRAEDGRITSYPAVVEIGETVAQVVEAERFHAKEKGLELNFVLSQEPNISGGKTVRPLYYVFADPHRINEVLQNIIDNAIKYTMEGSVTVRLTGDSSVVQIQVSDTGAGIPSEDIPHLFQKFYRVDSTATRTVGGTGLGLFISKKILELYEGRIWVTSQLGKGSTFFINLPRLSTAEALEAQKKQSALTSPI